MKALAIAAAVALIGPETLPAQYPTASSRAAVVALSAAYIGNALLGAHIAIRDNLPEAPFGIHSSRSVRSEFFLGAGTSLSPGLPMLAVHAAVAAMIAGPASTSRKATHALAVGGGLYFVGQVSEPMTYRVLRHPLSAPRDRLAVVVGIIVLTVLMTGAALHALK
jgi:hypothetical protein